MRRSFNRACGALVIVSGTLGLGGCAQPYHAADYAADVSPTQPSPASPTDQEVAEQVRAAEADCEDQHRRKIIKTATKTVECFETRLRNISKMTDHPLTDTDQLLIAKMLELAEKVDRKQLTKAEARLQLAEYQIAIKERAAAEARRQQAIIDEREQVEAETRALESQAEAARREAATRQLLGAAAIFGAMAGPSRLPYGAYQLPSGVVTCDQNGTITTCH